MTDVLHDQQLALADEDAVELQGKQQQLKAKQDRVKAQLDDRQRLLQQLIALEAANADLRRRVYQQRLPTLRDATDAAEEEEDAKNGDPRSDAEEEDASSAAEEDDFTSPDTGATRAPADTTVYRYGEGQGLEPVQHQPSVVVTPPPVPSAAAGDTDTASSPNRAERESKDGGYALEPSRTVLIHPSRSSMTSIFSNSDCLSEMAAADRKRTRSSVPKAAERSLSELHAMLDVYLPSANAQLRDNLRELLRTSRRVALEVGNLSKEERADVMWMMGHTTAEESKDKHLGGNPLSLRMPLRDVLGDWAKAYRSQSSVQHVTHALDATRAMYAACQERLEKSGEGHLTEAFQNIGFSTPAPGLPPIYPFDVEDSPLNIVFDRSKPAHPGAAQQIRYATINKLIERLTHEQFADLNTRFVFLLTYHSFTTASELLDKLALRYDVPIPPNMTPGEIELFKQNKLDRIQIKVCSVLKNWLDEHWSDFAGESNRGLLQQLHSLTDRMLKSSASPLSTQLAKALRTLILKKQKKTGGRVHGLATMRKYPKSLVSAKMTEDGTFNLEDANPLEVARQLTLIDFDKFRNIEPREMLNQGWTKAAKHELAPNIVFMTDQFENISGWVQTEILKHDTPQRRAAVFNKFVDIGKHCRELNNFNSLCAIFCALNTNAIYRLKKTKELLPAKQLERLQEWKTLFAGERSFSNFRQALQQSLTPCIPYLGVFLQDLVFIDTGNQDNMYGMINFDKRCKLADRIRWIKQYQQEGYQFQSVPAIQIYLSKVLKRADANELFALSERVEPKEPKV